MRLKLISKLTISASVVLIVFMAIFAYVNLTALRKLLLEEAILDADKLSETIIRTTHYQMLENDRERVYQMIHEVGTQAGIERIRLITKEGFTIFSTDGEEIGAFLDKKAAACNMCHSGEKPLLQASSMNRSRIFRSGGNQEVLGMAKAIYNEKKCSAAPCHFHPRDARVLGVLDVIVSLDNMHRQLVSYRNKIIFSTVILLGITSLCLSLSLQQLVSKPVKQLLRQTEKLSRGEMDSSINFSSTDELGELANSFNVMTQKLGSARSELEEWAKTLEARVEKRTRELKQIQSQLVRSEKLASLGKLAAGVAHEINNPLTGILMFASLTAKNPSLEPAVKSDLDTIIAETQRCAQIVKGLLDFSRESVPQKKPASINGIMDATLALIENQSRFQNITIVREYGTDLPSVSVDPNQIEQVFVNMLLNAGDAMPAGGKIIIKTDGRENQVRIIISDTGIGISEENLAKIFDPFFTTKASKGTGLGLSVSYGIIESHGGKIEVESTIGIGTTVTIALPIQEGNAAQAETV
jgi:two-component system, NtrC family, sensor kinase